MMKGGHGPTKESQGLNWGAFDHASHATITRVDDIAIISKSVLSCKILYSVHCFLIQT